MIEMFQMQNASDLKDRGTSMALALFVGIKYVLLYFKAGVIQRGFV